MGREILERIIENISKAQHSPAEWNLPVKDFADFFRTKSRRFTATTDCKLSCHNSEQFRDGVKIGEIQFSNNSDEASLSLCAFKVCGELSERSGKKAQYEEAKRYLKENNNLSAGIFIFYDTAGNFRFSLVYAEYSGIRRDFSHFRRFTYFVSPEFTNKTFLQRIGDGDFSTLANIKEAFAVEKVTKEFYQEIAAWYYVAIDNCQFPVGAEKEADGRKVAVIRLVTRIIFIWFMRVRGLVPKELFEESILQLLQDPSPTSSSYYHGILQNLFFATLSVEQDNRRFTDETRGIRGHNDDFGDHTVFRYHDLFHDHNQAIAILREIPFLNGGLFECLDNKEKRIYIDGFSRTLKNRPLVPSYLFFGKGDGETPKGIFSMLSAYNFTIDENSPMDQEVALDPELLGRVFENLLANFNPETSTTARKATGSYYTPREIVDYMVAETLKEYFRETLASCTESSLPPSKGGATKGEGVGGNIEEKLHNLFDNSASGNPFNDTETKALIRTIESCRICDPAVGSGAFPMGILNKMVFVLHRLDHDCKIWKQTHLEATEAIADSDSRAIAYKSMQDFFQKKNPDYIRKLLLIQNCIYGVDIQQIAVEIAKLRFFISLLVDETIDRNEKNWNIQPLPNLDYKIVCGDSLLGLDVGLWGAESLREMEKTKVLYFNETDPQEKQRQKDKINQLIAKLTKGNGGFAYNLYFSEVCGADSRGGFDIVIGNPPYIQLQKNGGALADKYQLCGYQTFARTGDIYGLFYEQGVRLLKLGGHLCFITSNSWMRAGYGAKLRDFFLQQTPKLLIDLGRGIFENATVDTNILLLQKSKSFSPKISSGIKAVTLKKEPNREVDIAKQVAVGAVYLRNLSAATWFVGNEAEQCLKEKIERLGRPLKDWDVNIYYGIKTGLNDAFIIDTPTKERLCAEDPKSAEILKPILRGCDISRYSYQWAGLWLLASGFDTDVPLLYPAIYKHLLQFEDRAKKRDDQGENWWNLRSCAYYHEFEKEKVVWIELVDNGRFACVEANMYTEATTFLMTSPNPRYIAGALNAQVINWFFDTICASSGTGTNRWKKVYVEQLPIPAITPANEKIVTAIETLVEQILALKKSDQDADNRKLEKQIDQLVYKLYDLTDNEIAMIEGGH